MKFHWWTTTQFLQLLSVRILSDGCLSWVTSAQTTLPVKPKIFTFCPFTGKKNSQAIAYTMKHLWLCPACVMSKQAHSNAGSTGLSVEWSMGCEAAFLKSCTAWHFCYCLHKTIWWRGSGHISWEPTFSNRGTASLRILVINQHILGTVIWGGFILKFKKEGIPVYMLASLLKKENKPTLSICRFNFGLLLFASHCSLSLSFFSYQM